MPAFEEFNAPGLSAARYRAARDAEQRGEEPTGPDPEGDARVPKFKSTDDVGQRADAIVTRAIREGDFDHLQYAGKPTPDLGGTLDPDWWVKGLIEREKLTGFGPPAIMLRHEDAALAETLDGLPSEQAVTEHLEDFNRRVIETRRQLQGGPPVVTKVKDVEAELEAWRERRAARQTPYLGNDEAGADVEPTGIFRRMFRKSS